MEVERLVGGMFKENAIFFVVRWILAGSFLIGMLLGFLTDIFTLDERAWIFIILRSLLLTCEIFSRITLLVVI